MERIPEDLRIEWLLDYLPPEKRRVRVVGPHKRNAYEDLAAIEESEETDLINISVARKGFYDILPEALFHPLDRFDHLPEDDYDRRFKEEVEAERLEEENARNFFSPFDRFFLEFSTQLIKFRERATSRHIIVEMIADRLPENYASNRFVKKSLMFLPKVSLIRGDRFFITQLIRYALKSEETCLRPNYELCRFKDPLPAYLCELDAPRNVDEAIEDPSQIRLPNRGEETYLGNEFDEETEIFHVAFWDEHECDENFLRFIDELEVFSDFINDFFMGVGQILKFEVSQETIPPRLDDDKYYNYLDYNTNI
ncbi:MAG: hypothetical protein J1D77_00925 [Muribaculaceae bacterium]|nr:hypothetical protein [Muribaculaceae bacterium]